MSTTHNIQTSKTRKEKPKVMKPQKPKPKAMKPPKRAQTKFTTPGYLNKLLEESED